jgi:DNA-binding MarR family transcriptional regulator
MSDQRLADVLRYLADHDGASLPRVAKQLSLSQSQLLRLLAALGDDAAIGGLGLVEARIVDGRRRLSLSARGQAWLSQQA